MKITMKQKIKILLSRLGHNVMYTFSKNYRDHQSKLLDELFN